MTKDDALAIAGKLKAEIVTKRRAHDIALIYENGKLVAQFGIRRGSKRDQGHDHIPGKIFETAHNARMLALCPRSREDWLNNMEAKGQLPPK